MWILHFYHYNRNHSSDYNFSTLISQLLQFYHICLREIRNVIFAPALILSTSLRRMGPAVTLTAR